MTQTLNSRGTGLAGPGQQNGPEAPAESVHAFKYVNPSTVYYGAGAVGALDGALRESDVARVHIVTTRSLLESDALRQVRAASRLLQSAGLSTISAHVPLEGVRDIARDIRRTGAEAVVALGGGSTIDAAKFASLASVSGDLDLASLPAVKAALVGGPARGVSPLPIFCVPTTLSAAELEGGGGWTNNRTGDKEGALHPALTPRAVIYDPQVSAETPPWLWLATGLRSLDHAIESLLPSQVNPFSATLAKSAVADLFELLPRYAEDPTSSPLRLACQLASWKSYTAPHASASGLSHVLGKAVGAKNGIPHGITSCVILPQVIRYHARNPGLQNSIKSLSDALGLAEAPVGQCTLADALEDLVRRLGLPTRFTRHELTKEAQQEAAARASQLLGMPFETVNEILRSCIA